jgi:predicted transposase YdaD
MPRHEFDKSSKWLLQRHGRGILFLGGARGVRSCRALQAEVVQPRRLPDGLLEVFFHGRKKPDYVLVEVATYPEKRVPGQVLDDLMLTYQQLRQLPELLTLVLHPRGQLRVSGKQELESRLQWSKLVYEWKVVELWTVPAEDLLTAGEVGLIPWVPLTRFQGPPEALLEQCRQRIEQQAPPQEQANLLAVAQVLARLRFKDPLLLALLGGKRVVIESPLIKEIVAESLQEAILELLQDRFGAVPREVATPLRAVLSKKKLLELNKLAARCPDLETFRTRLLS